MTKSNWFNLGTLRSKEVETQDGDTVRKSWIVLDKNVTILVDGEEVNLGDYRTVKLIDPRPGLDSALENGSIDEGKHKELVNGYDERNVVYKLTVPPVD